jgi:hypothetical protein
MSATATLAGLRLDPHHTLETTTREALCLQHFVAEPRTVPATVRFTAADEATVVVFEFEPHQGDVDFSIAVVSGGSTTVAVPPSRSECGKLRDGSIAMAANADGHTCVELRFVSGAVAAGVRLRATQVPAEAFTAAAATETAIAAAAAAPPPPPVSPKPRAATATSRSPTPERAFLWDKDLGWNWGLALPGEAAIARPFPDTRRVPNAAARASILETLESATQHCVDEFMRDPGAPLYGDTKAVSRLVDAYVTALRREK